MVFIFYKFSVNFIYQDYKSLLYSFTDNISYRKVKLNERNATLDLFATDIIIDSYGGEENEPVRNGFLCD